MSPIPGGEPVDDSKVEKPAEVKETGEEQHLSLADLVAPIGRDTKKLEAPKTQKPHELTAAEKENAANRRASELGFLFNQTTDSPYLYDQQGRASQYDIQAVKSEFKEDKPEAPAPKELVNQFLKDTEVPEDKKPEKPEDVELIETRQQLAESDDLDDIIEKLLKLAELYEHEQCIEEAKKAVSISLGVDPDNPQATQLFKHLEQVQLPDVAVVNPPATSLMLSRFSLRNAIRKLSSGKVIVLGDLIIDEILEGTPERISREAPVLILEHVGSELRLGGAGNAAHNVAALGATCYALGICGADSYAEKLSNLLKQAGISYDLVEDPSRPTTVKTRVLSSTHSFKQQLLRLDRISHSNIPAPVEQELIKCLQNVPGQYGGIILSDYRCGSITNKVIAACQSVAKEHKLTTVVDAQCDFTRFQGFTLAAPNQPDVEQMVGFSIKNAETLKQAGRKMLELTSTDYLLLTRGAEGMVLFAKGKEPVELEAFNRSEVSDVTGAGDTVVAAASLALITGASPVEAMAIGNLAASIVVKKSGAATTSQAELLSALELLSIPD